MQERKRILIIEDHDLVVWAITRQIEKNVQDAEVYTAMLPTARIPIYTEFSEKMQAVIAKRFPTGKGKAKLPLECRIS